MAYNDEHIFQLILEKLSGEISDENRRYLEQAAREDEKIRRCLEEMEDASKRAGPEFMDDVYNEIAWSNVLSLLDNETPATRIVTMESGMPDNEPPATRVVTLENEVPENKPVKKFRNYTWWIAAATLLIFSSLFYFFKTNLRSSLFARLLHHNNIAIPLDGDIMFVTGNGDTIHLPAYDGTAVTLTELIPEQPNELWGTLLVPACKDYKVIMSDGSLIHLNAFSSLHFPLHFTGDTREVVLSGEAYFTIASSAEQAFIVRSGSAKIKVLGTSFNVNAYADSLIVTSLIQGSVITKDNYQPEIQLRRGMESVYHKGYPVQVRNFDENVVLSWRKGQYNYYNESLSQLEAVILHWYGKELLFDNAALAAKKLTGIIERDKPLTDFLDGLGRTSGLAYKINNNKVYLSETK